MNIGVDRQFDVVERYFRDVLDGQFDVVGPSFLQRPVFAFDRQFERVRAPDVQRFGHAREQADRSFEWFELRFVGC